MFLKQIILKNFKSFTGKTVLDFPDFFTAIVGPNGSGKSTVVDAIRWALGEQSFKNLRIDKGSDLIFSGLQKNTSAGFAEVELIFNNKQNNFPLEFSEISFRRRIDKGEVNTYFINNQVCRLKDIVETSASAKGGFLFSKASVSMKASVSNKSASKATGSTERTYSMAIHVRAVQDELPGGMEKILGILEDAIKSQPAAITA